ncbi:hypothetical protein [Hymenobacter gelipurpurascens]|nr:hypothetical protein [Hymenobacter gelipurpurascens]
MAKPSILKHPTSRLGLLLPGTAPSLTSLGDKWLWAVADQHPYHCRGYA